MGCCCSKQEEDRFDDRSALLPKGQTTERSARDEDVVKAKHFAVGSNGHYAKPVTTVAAPVAKPVPATTSSSSCCSGGGCSSKTNGNAIPNAKKTQEEVHPTVKSVDLLGLDQPPSPPPTMAKPTVASPAKPQSPARSSSLILPKEEPFVGKVGSPVKPAAVAEPESPKEALSDLMPPRPTPPPSRTAPPAPAPAPAPTPAPAPVPVPVPEPVVVAPVSLEESVDLDDGNEDGGDGDGGDDDFSNVTTSSTTASSTASTASNKSNKKKKKKKGKK